MVVYIVYGFRWSRVGTLTAPGIRPHIVINDLLDAASDYIQEPRTAKEVIQSFERIDANIPSHLPNLALIEQYDPEDTRISALSQPYAFVCSKVVPIGDGSEPQFNFFLSLDLEDFISKGPGLSAAELATFANLREVLAPGEKIGWWIVYNGNPERFSSDKTGSDSDTTEGDGEPEEAGHRSGPPVCVPIKSIIIAFTHTVADNPVSPLDLSNLRLFPQNRGLTFRRGPESSSLRTNLTSFPWSAFDAPTVDSSVCYPKIV